MRGLEILEEELASWVAAEPAAAVDVYEAFLAGCYERAGEIDDSGGNFGEFVQERLGGWVRARQAEPVGEGVSELRIDHGPGHRVYFLQRGGEVIVLLVGGGKATQAKDAERAKELAKQV